MKILANNIQFNYELTGQAGAPVVMLSHSLASSMVMWDSQLVSLEPHFQVLRYDMRGHGDSDGVANGIIVDPGGVVDAATVGLDPGAGGGCFIASATLGSSMEPNLKLHAASYLARIFHVLSGLRLILPSL